MVRQCGSCASRSSNTGASRSDRGGTGWISAEKGYLRETGNLLFHLSLIGILAGVALGHFFGFKGAVLVTEGSGFADTPDGWRRRR